MIYRPTQACRVVAGARRPAFTLVEMMIVMAIIAVIVVSVLVAGTAMQNRARATNTRFMLNIAQDAINTFRNAQEDRPTITRQTAYRARYGSYPPDEFEPFTESGVPGGVARSLANGEIVPGTTSSLTYSAMTFQQSGLNQDQARMEHRDIGAMIMTLELYNDTTAEILSKIPGDKLVTPLDANGDPLQYLDRNENEAFDPESDHPIRRLIDDWGVPITYFAQRDFDPDGDPDATQSSNHAFWNEASTAMIRLNGSVPLLCSYGPDGPDQLAPDILSAIEPPSTLIEDWMDNQRIDSPYNQDNVYPDEGTAQKLARGAP